MTTHAWAFELLPLYALDALPAGEQQAVGAHVDHCAACRGELAEQHRVAAVLAADQPAPRRVWARIEAAIDDRGQDDPRAGR